MSDLRAAILACDVWDTHTHLIGAELPASDFWEIGHYFWLLRELRAAGYPAEHAQMAPELRAAAYARAVFGRYPAQHQTTPDAVTANPYLGSDGVMPFLTEADELGAGVFVLVKTSNPSSAELQDLDAGGWPIYRHVAELVKQWGEERVGESGWSSVGAVVGATWPRQLVELREAMPQTPLLLPGYGAQGGGAKDVLAAFDQDGLGAVVNSSRGIIYAFSQERYADRFGPDGWDRAAAAAAGDMRGAINDALAGR